MPLWRKCLLGPEASVACVSCGRKVGIPYPAVAAAIPIALGIVGAVRLHMPWSWAAAVGGVVSYVLLQRYVVPLVGRDG
jgi:hypothetical protein